MDIQIRALDTFQHGYHRGRLDAETGKLYALPESEAAELVKRNLAVLDDTPAEAAPQTGVTDSDAEAAAAESVDDLLGGDKADTEPENKMEKPAKNKAAK
jgi:hypothetical protein